MTRLTDKRLDGCHDTVKAHTVSSSVDFLALGKRRILSLLVARLKTVWFVSVYDKHVLASTTRTLAESPK